MCGRYTLRASIEELAEILEAVSERVGNTKPRYNIAPSQEVIAARVAERGDERELVRLRWGLVPSWAKEPSTGMRPINARSETVAEKPAFRVPFRRRRCLVPADGFYEWSAPVGGRKQPFFFQFKDERPFCFAGLWDKWAGRDGEVIESCAILTTAANEVLAPVHDRMPVIVAPGDYELWLDDDERNQDLRVELLRPYPADEMTSRPVSTLVNRPANEGAELLRPARPDSG